MSKSVSPVYDALMKPVADHGRNQFPLDNRHIYSMKAGQITPVKCFHYKPADFFRFKVKDFSLTFPMNTAAFLRGRKEFAFYSVYYNAVWSLYNQYQGTRPDPKTSVFGASILQTQLKEPRIALLDLLTACWSQFVYYCYYTYDTKYDAQGNDNTVLQQRYAQGTLLNRAYTDFSNGITVEDCWTQRFSAAAQSRIYYTPWETNNLSSFTVRDFMFDIVGQPRCFNWLRKLDMLGYGNFYPLFKKTEAQIIARGNGIKGDVSAQQTYTHLQEDLTLLMIDLFDATVRYDTSAGFSTATNLQPKYVNLYPICAYNAIFYHFFRNSYYDLNYNTHDYNLDFMSLVNSSSSNYMIADLQDFSTRFLDIEYHQWKKDKFTAVLPDQQFGAVAKLDISNVNIINDHVMSGSGVTNVSAGNVSSSEPGKLLTASTPNYYPDWTIPNAVDVVALKRAEMLQDYRQQLMRAGNKTSDVFRAIYGESPSSEHEEDIVPRFLETFGEDIFVDPIVSTADTGQPVNGNLGDLSARGKLSGDSKEFTFNAGGNFGVILALAYVVPQAEYNSYMTDKHLEELTPEDHYIPQFENLGLEDIYTPELNCLRSLNDMASLGKAPRYHHKKTEVDMVHGAFVSEFSTSSSPWYSAVASDFYGDFNHWVSPRTEFQYRKNTLLRDLYVNPSVLDNVFVRAAGADQADDQFICNTYFDIQATKELSKVGFVSF